MKSITIIPLSDRGREALKKHLDEKAKMPNSKLRQYKKIILDEMDGDALKLSYVKPKFNALLSGDYLTFMIKDVMLKNGAYEGTDYKTVVEE